MKLRKNIAISETGFIFNPLTGDSFSTNLVGLDVITLLREGKTMNEVSKFVTDKYGTEVNDFEKDLEDFRIELRDYQLLEA
jgi:hypothetical protein